jgi:hypothetical protein
MMKNPKAHQVKVRPTIHAAFHHLETIHVAFNRAIVPCECQTSLDSGMVVTKWAHEGAPLGNSAVESRRKPLIPLRAASLARELQELVHQQSRPRHLRMDLLDAKPGFPPPSAPRRVSRASRRRGGESFQLVRKARQAVALVVPACLIRAEPAPPSCASP